MADRETLEGESGIVPIDPRRRRPPTALGRLDAGVTSMAGTLACPYAVIRRIGGGAMLADDGGGVETRPPSSRCTVVVTLVTGETVTWAGAAPDGRQLRSPGIKCRRAGPLFVWLLARELTEVVEDAAVGGVDAAPRDPADTTDGMPGTGERRGTGGDSEPGEVTMDSCEGGAPRLPAGGLLAADGAGAPDAAAAAAACACACFLAASAIACASVCCGCWFSGDTGFASLEVGWAGAADGGGGGTGVEAVVALENVDFTLEKMEGRRPGSGSSWNGFGNVVRLAVEGAADGRVCGGADAAGEGRTLFVVDAGAVADPPPPLPLPPPPLRP